jgi:hypothetical protein
MLLKAIFLSNSKSIHLCLVVFLCIPAGWEAYMTSMATNRSVPEGVGVLVRSPPCFLLVSWELYMIPSRTTTHFLYSHLD